MDGKPDSWAMPQNSSSDLDGESIVSGVGSMGSTDHAHEEDFKSAQPARKIQAFVGASAEEKWIQRLEKELPDSPVAGVNPTQCPPFPRSTNKPPNSKGDMYEDTESSTVGNQIDPDDLPLRSTSDALVNAYFVIAYPSCPIVDKTSFLIQYEECCAVAETETYGDRTFLALLQLVFAIGATHAHVVRADWAGDDRDHVLYFGRARVLGVETGILNDSVYHGQVQFFGLSGMYFLTTNQINR